MGLARPRCPLCRRLSVWSPGEGAVSLSVVAVTDGDGVGFTGSVSPWIMGNAGAEVCPSAGMGRRGSRAGFRCLL